MNVEETQKEISRWIYDDSKSKYPNTINNQQRIFYIRITFNDYRKGNIEEISI